MGGFGAPRTGEGGRRGARASARHGGTYGTKAAGSKWGAIRNVGARRVVKLFRRGRSLPTRQMLFVMHSEPIEGEVLDTVAETECPKCLFPRRKDYKHTCHRAYGRGRSARPALPTERVSRTGRMLAIGFNGERHCPSHSTRIRDSRIRMLPTAPVCWWQVPRRRQSRPCSQTALKTFACTPARRPLWSQLRQESRAAGWSTAAATDATVAAAVAEAAAAALASAQVERRPPDRRPGPFRRQHIEQRLCSRVKVQARHAQPLEQARTARSAWCTRRRACPARCQKTQPLLSPGPIVPIVDSDSGLIVVR